MALHAFAPPLENFGCGRDFAAWAGLTPRQHSTAGKQRLGRITKMGQRDLRQTAARLHRDETRSTIGEVFKEPRSGQLQINDLVRVRFDPVQLKYPLRRVDADDRSVSLHFGPSGLSGKTPNLPPWAL